MSSCHRTEATIGSRRQGLEAQIAIETLIEVATETRTMIELVAMVVSGDLITIMIEIGIMIAENALMFARRTVVRLREIMRDTN